MKEKIQKFLKSSNAILLALFILELVLMFFITPNKYDDKGATHAINGANNGENDTIKRTNDLLKNLT